MPDGPENDYFATQFATAIVRESGDPPDWWFGRLLRYLDNTEFKFLNFFGIDYTETTFREKYEKGEILVDRFDISDVNYEIDPKDSNFATVTMDVEIEARIDEKSQSGKFKLTHKVKLGWQTYESTLS